MRQVATRTSDACGLGYDDAIVCFGTSPPSPPSTHYLRLASAGTDFCGLTLDLTIECFGGALPDAPLGTYLLVSRGSGYASS